VRALVVFVMFEKEAESLEERLRRILQ
jgi:hypothetical protein